MPVCGNAAELDADGEESLIIVVLGSIFTTLFLCGVHTALSPQSEPAFGDGSEELTNTFILFNTWNRVVCLSSPRGLPARADQSYEHLWVGTYGLQARYGPGNL